MLDRREPDQALAVAVHDRVGRHHLGVEPGARAKQTMEDAAMAVRPIHHRGHGKNFTLMNQCLILYIHGPKRERVHSHVH